MVSKDYLNKLKERYIGGREFAREKGWTDAELEQKQSENITQIAQARGHILNRVCEIEHELDIFLASYFTGDNLELWEKFSDLILRQEFLSLHQKIVLFGKIGHHKQSKFLGEFDDLDRTLNEIKEIRNLVAHGAIGHFTSPEIFTPKTSAMLDKAYLANFNEKSWIAFFCLAELCDSLSGINKNFKDS